MEKDIRTIFRVLKFPALFPTCLARRKKREISKPGKNRGLESLTNIFSFQGKPYIIIYHAKLEEIYRVDSRQMFLTQQHSAQLQKCKSCFGLNHQKVYELHFLLFWSLHLSAASTLRILCSLFPIFCSILSNFICEYFCSIRNIFCSCFRSNYNNNNKASFEQSSWSKMQEILDATLSITQMIYILQMI